LILQEQQVDDQINEITDQFVLFRTQLSIFTDLINEWQVKSWTNIAQHQRALQEYNETPRSSWAESESWKLAQDWEKRVIEALQIQQGLAEDRFFLELLMDQMRKDVAMLQNVKLSLNETMRMEMASV